MFILFVINKCVDMYFKSDYIRERFNEVNYFKAISRYNILLLDYETNTDVWDPSKPLSHAGLIKAYIEGTYPGSVSEEIGL